MPDIAEQADHIVVAHDDDDYPEMFRQLRGKPQLLYVRGDVDALHLPCFAIVGSRNPTDGGERNAYEFARHLARCGFCIVSGLATGVDAASHRGAIDVGGKTIAFLGHGIDKLYPARNRQLAEAIERNGALVSEYPPGMQPLPALFPQRNRLISGLSLGTLVVEAARQSGSLITARYAAEQGREVFALPGSIHNPLSRGCHRLIGDGAKLVECADDIIAELQPLTGHLRQISMESKTAEMQGKTVDGPYVKLGKFLSHDPVSVNELADRSGLTIGQVSSMLLILELDGIVEKLSGGKYALQH